MKALWKCLHTLPNSELDNEIFQMTFKCMFVQLQNQVLCSRLYHFTFSLPSQGEKVKSPVVFTLTIFCWFFCLLYHFLFKPSTRYLVNISKVTSPLLLNASSNLIVPIGFANCNTEILSSTNTSKLFDGYLRCSNRTIKTSLVLHLVVQHAISCSCSRNKSLWNVLHNWLTSHLVRSQ